MTTNNPENSDRELLELAAKAAGIDIFDWTPGGQPTTDGAYTGIWNPLYDDGDALRLAIKMGFNLSLPSSPNQVFVQVGERGSVPFALERIGGNPLSATRRAIVRAAAEMGRGKP